MRQTPFSLRWTSLVDWPRFNFTCLCATQKHSFLLLKQRTAPIEARGLRKWGYTGRANKRKRLSFAVKCYTAKHIEVGFTIKRDFQTEGLQRVWKRRVRRADLLTNCSTGTVFGRLSQNVFLLFSEWRFHSVDAMVPLSRCVWANGAEITWALLY